MGEACYLEQAKRKELTCKRILFGFFFTAKKNGANSQTLKKKKAAIFGILIEQRCPVELSAKTKRPASVLSHVAAVGNMWLRALTCKGAHVTGEQNIKFTFNKFKFPCKEPHGINGCSVGRAG